MVALRNPSHAPRARTNQKQPRSGQRKNTSGTSLARTPRFAPCPTAAWLRSPRRHPGKFDRSGTPRKPGAAPPQGARFRGGPQGEFREGKATCGRDDHRPVAFTHCTRRSGGPPQSFRKPRQADGAGSLQSPDDLLRIRGARVSSGLRWLHRWDADGSQSASSVPVRRLPLRSTSTRWNALHGNPESGQR